MTTSKQPEESFYSEWFPREAIVDPVIRFESVDYDPVEERVEFNVRDGDGVLHPGSLRLIGDLPSSPSTNQEAGAS